MQTIIRTAQTTLYVMETIDQIETMIVQATGKFIKVHDALKAMPILIAINTINLVSVIEDSDEI